MTIDHSFVRIGNKKGIMSIWSDEFENHMNSYNKRPVKGMREVRPKFIHKSKTIRIRYQENTNDQS